MTWISLQAFKKPSIFQTGIEPTLSVTSFSLAVISYFTSASEPDTS